METTPVLRGMAARVRSTGTIRSIPAVLVVGIALIAGCMKDIPYDATAEKSAAADSQPDPDVSLPEPEAGEVDLFANVPVEGETTPPAESVAPPEADPAGTPQPEPPAELAPAEEPGEQNDEDLFNSVFGPRESDKIKPEVEPEAEPAPEPTPDPMLATLPEPTPPAVEEMDPAEISEAKAMEPPAAKPATPADQGSLLPWEIPDDEETTSQSEAPTREAPAETEPAPVAEAGTVKDVPEMASAEPLPFEPEEPKPTPTEPKPMDSRDLTWRLASRLSYLLLAPDTDADLVREELTPVATVLEFQLPDFTVAEAGSQEQLKQLLAVGRELGEEAAAKFGAEHAALVEIAFKSNLLLAVAEDRPQLRHGINGSVSAAAVRAGLPEAVWKPFQNEVANHDDAASLTEAVLRLHTDVGKYFEELPVAHPESEQPVLR